MLIIIRVCVERDRSEFPSPLPSSQRCELGKGSGGVASFFTDGRAEEKGATAAEVPSSPVFFSPSLNSSLLFPHLFLRERVRRSVPPLFLLPSFNSLPSPFRHALLAHEEEKGGVELRPAPLSSSLLPFLFSF